MDQTETINTVGVHARKSSSVYLAPLSDTDNFLSARATLKRETHEIHQQLHDLPAFVDLMNGRLSPLRYQRVMSGFLSFYKMFDHAAAQATRRFDSRLAGHTYVPRAPLFRADVNNLGGDARDYTAIEQCHISFGSLAEYVGALYVVDGSVLGGVTMNKALTKNPELANSGATTYWLWCQKHGLAQWKSTLELVEKAWQSETNSAAITAAALQTFGTLHDCLSGVDDCINEANAHE